MIDERPRIAFLVERDGLPATQWWALDAARTYRLAVLQRHARWRKDPSKPPKYTMYRRVFIESYLQLKRYGLRPATEAV